jgi:hypothetical protein
MAVKKPVRDKKYFTVSEANATLPLVRAIVRDIMDLAKDLRERQDRLSRVRTPERISVPEAHAEELRQAQAEFERDQERLVEYVQELKNLGVELKDYFTGLVDFPSRLDGRDVYLCWRFGEADVAHWHELDAGFAGRQQLRIGVARTSSS